MIRYITNDSHVEIFIKKIVSLYRNTPLYLFMCVGEWTDHQSQLVMFHYPTSLSFAFEIDNQCSYSKLFFTDLCYIIYSKLG